MPKEPIVVFSTAAHEPQDPAMKPRAEGALVIPKPGAVQVLERNPILRVLRGEREHKR